MADSAHLRLPYLEAAQAQKHVTHNEALDVLDALIHLTVADRHLASPPLGAVEGDRYIVADAAADDWAGQEDAVAIYQADAWVFHAPRRGWLAWVEDEAALLIWTGSAWADLFSALAGVNNLVRLGVGTAADAGNPLSAKINKALFAALSSGEGGTGDLRYTLNKEAAGNVLSMLFQSGWGGRVEFGLVGSDDFTLKVSGDGAAWHDALRIDRDSGAVDLPNGFSGAHSLSRQWASISSGALAIDYRAGQHVEVTLDQDVTALSVANWPANGGDIVLLVKQDGTGGRSVAWPAGWRVAGGAAPAVTPTAWAMDRFRVSFDGATVFLDTLGQAYG